MPSSGKLLLLSALVVSLALAAEPPLMMIRLRGPHTASDAQWAKTFKALTENRGACDEVWFSTGIGFPRMSWHEAHVKRLARYASQMRAAGIVPSLQFQATLGHSDTITALEGADGKTWGGFTGRGGLECTLCNCPRQPGFLDYVREMARLYASFRPGSIWIDDDLRIAGHSPGSPWEREKDGWIGCWCRTCVGDFNRETGGNWTRESLDGAMKKDAALFGRWETFSFSSIAAVAKAIAEETHRVSPETKLAYQHGPYRNASQLALFRAMAEVTGMKVGSRPGGGAYYDSDPHAQNVKAFMAARQRKALGDPEMIDNWCPEVETYPRAFASRTAQGLLNESIVNLAYGMTSLSFLVLDTRSETDAWYSENLLAPLSAEKGLLAEYRAFNWGTVPAGMADGTSLSPPAIYRLALTGVPVVPGVGKSFGSLSNDDFRDFNIDAMSSAALLDLRRKMDARAGGKLPVVVEDPSIGLVTPRVLPDGTLRSVMVMNCRIDWQKPVKLRLRGVLPSVSTAIWHAFHEKPVELPVMREGSDAFVTIPALSAWNAGWVRL